MISKRESGLASKCVVDGGGGGGRGGAPTDGGQWQPELIGHRQRAGRVIVYHVCVFGGSKTRPANLDVLDQVKRNLLSSVPTRPVLSRLVSHEPPPCLRGQAAPGPCGVSPLRRSTCSVCFVMATATATAKATTPSEPQVSVLVLLWVLCFCSKSAQLAVHSMKQETRFTQPDKSILRLERMTGKTIIIPVCFM